MRHFFFLCLFICLFSFCLLFLHGVREREALVKRLADCRSMFVILVFFFFASLSPRSLSPFADSSISFFYNVSLSPSLCSHFSVVCSFGIFRTIRPLNASWPNKLVIGFVSVKYPTLILTSFFRAHLSLPLYLTGQLAIGICLFVGLALYSTRRHLVIQRSLILCTAKY